MAFYWLIKGVPNHSLTGMILQVPSWGWSHIPLFWVMDSFSHKGYVDSLQNIFVQKKCFSRPANQGCQTKYFWWVFETTKNKTLIWYVNQNCQPLVSFKWRKLCHQNFRIFWPWAKLGTTNTISVPHHQLTKRPPETTCSNKMKSLMEVAR